MKALVIHDHHFCHLLVYMEKMHFCGSLCSLLEYFREKKLPPDHHSHLGWGSLTDLFLSNIMKYGENDIERQTSMSLSDFWYYLRKREESFNRGCRIFFQNCCIISQNFRINIHLISHGILRTVPFLMVPPLPTNKQLVTQ